MNPHVIMLMSSSIDGRLHPSRWSASPQGDRDDWSRLYERTHADLAGDGWIVGRVTMAEMSKAEAHPPAQAGAVERPVHVAADARAPHAVALDPHGRLHFAKGDVGGDAAIVLLGRNVTDAHLAELAADGVSYVVAETEPMDLAGLLNTLNERFGIERLLLEGGGGINGAFLAAGLVDELCVLVAPALDGGIDVQGIVEHGVGLQGKVALALTAADPLEHGVVRLLYAVTMP